MKAQRCSTRLPLGCMVLLIACGGAEDEETARKTSRDGQGGRPDAGANAEGERGSSEDGAGEGASDADRDDDAEPASEAGGQGSSAEPGGSVTDAGADADGSAAGAGDSSDADQDSGSDAPASDGMDGDAGGGAADTDDEVASDGGPLQEGPTDDVASAELRARVIAFDPDTALLATFDAAGDLQQDFWPLQSDDEQFVLSASWDSLTYHSDRITGSPRVETDFGGLTTTSSDRLVLGFRHPDGSMEVELRSLDGDLDAALVLDEAWQSHTLSPDNGYVLLHREIDDPDYNREAAVVRWSDGAEVWRGPYAEAGFALDDSHLVFVPGVDNPVSFVDLDTGEVVGATNPDFYDFPSGYTLGSEAISSLGCVLRTYGGVSYGQPLWYLDWEGNLSPVDSALPLFAVDQFAAFRDDGWVVRWYRSSTGPVEGYDPIDEALLGWHEYDVATGTSRVIEAPGNCDDDDVRYFEVVGDVLRVCSCDRDECTERELPTSQWSGGAGVETSPSQRYALVSYYWFMNSVPESYPASVLYDAVDDEMIEVPDSRGEFSRDEQLLLLTAGRDSALGIVELETGVQTWMSLPWRSGIVYE